MNLFRSLTSALTSCVSRDRSRHFAIAAMALATATSCGGARASKCEVPQAWPPALPTAAVEAPTTSPAASAASETTEPWSDGMSDTAPNRFVEKNGIRFAYRAFGRKPGVPLLLLAPFRGTMDSWDPLLTDELARGRPVILFDNAGVGLSNGDAPTTVAGHGEGCRDVCRRAPRAPLHRFRLGVRARRPPRIFARRVRRSTARAESSGRRRPCGSRRHGASGRRGVRNAFAGDRDERDRGSADAARCSLPTLRQERGERGRRASLPCAGRLSPKRSRQFGHHQDDTCATRGHEGVGRGPEDRTLLVSLGRQAASARRRWRGRRRDAHDQLEGSCAEPAKRPPSHLPRLGAGLSLPVPRRLREGRCRIPTTTLSRPR